MDLCTVNFSLLPEHIVTRILRNLKLIDLKNASLVCKSWYNASNDPRIYRTLIICPKEENFDEICKSNRKYGILNLEKLLYGKLDSDYFKLFEKFGPFVHQLHIFLIPAMKIYHLLKLLEYAKQVKIIYFAGWRPRDQLCNLFPMYYDSNAKDRILENLSGLKIIEFRGSRNVPLMGDIIRSSTNLEVLSCAGEYTPIECTYKQFATLFDNYNAANLKHLNLNLLCLGYIDDFITSFVQIKNLNLKLFNLTAKFIWKDEIYKSSLFREFILKLQSLEELGIVGLQYDQLSIICQHLLNLRCFSTGVMSNGQPMSEIGNLKKLEALICIQGYWEISDSNLIEHDNFFKCKFEYLQLLIFQGFITETNLINLCQNHPNLLELRMNYLLTRNLEIIFQHLTKLRVLQISFGFKIIKKIPDIKVGIENRSLIDSEREYQYKISRLQDLEIVFLEELVNGIQEDDVRQLNKLRSSNLSELFDKQKKN